MYTLPWSVGTENGFADETSRSSSSTATTNTATTTGLNGASSRYNNKKWLKMHTVGNGDIIFGTEFFLLCRHIIQPI